MNENAASDQPANPAPDPAAFAKPISVQPTAAAPVKTGLTPGWKTTEFWMTAISQGAVLASALVGGMPPKYAALFGTIAQVAYNVSRGLAKSSPAR